LLGKVKQAIDARHVSGLGGWYVAGGSLYKPKFDNTLGGAEIGFEGYPTSWLSHRIGIGSYFSPDEGYIAGDAGVRLQPPTRLAPFVGTGVLLGASRTVELADDDGIDNDDDERIDERGEEDSGIDDFLAAVYPEAGVHFWINGNWRASAFGRYVIADTGRNHDDWMIGGQLTFFSRPSRSR
jgi:hypothetical protein